MIACANHPDRPAAVSITWDEDTYDWLNVCADCIVPTLASLETTVAGRLDTDPRFTIATIRQEA